MKKSVMTTTNIRLSLMMFLQYMFYAVWWVPLAAFLAAKGIDGTQNAMILSSMAIGCMASPLIGMIADHYFSGEKVLTFLNFTNAVLMFLAGMAQEPGWLFVYLLLAMLCYMPTWGLTSTIAMTHVSSEQFPRIRVFGSIGWVASGIFSLIAVKLFNTDFDGTHLPFFYAAGISLIAGVQNMTLPATPPLSKGKKASLTDVFGLRTVQLMGERNFAVFILLSFLSMIPFSMYWSYCSEFLFDQGFKYISITMNWGQLAEMFFLLTVPFAIKKVGLRWTLILGLIALLIRYLSFYAGSSTGLSLFYFAGILVHGIIFGYFYLGGQIYIDKKAKPGLKAQAQGFIFLVTFGAGLLVGNLISRRIIDQLSEVVDHTKTYDWNSIWGVTSIMTLALLLAFAFLFKSSPVTIAKENKELIEPDVKPIKTQL